MLVLKYQHKILALISRYVRDADEVLLFEPENLSWSLKEQAEKAGMQCFDSTIAIIETVLESIEPNQHVLIMSNGGFNGLHQQLVDGLANKYSGE